VSRQFPLFTGMPRAQKGADLVRRTAVVVAAGALLLLSGCNGGGSTGAKGSASAAPAAAVSVVPANGSTDVAPSTPLEIDVTGGKLASVTVVDAAGGSVTGKIGDAPAGGSAASSSSSSASNSSSSASSASAGSSSASSSSPAAAGGTSQVWTPDKPLAYGTKYTLTATARNAASKEAKASATFTTVTPKTQSTPSIGPLDGTTVGVGMPIRVYFDQSVADRAAVESHLQVISSKPTDGAWYWMNDKEVHFRPSTYWPADTDVTLKAALYGVDFGAGVWGQKDRTIAFHIGARHVSVADASAHTMQVYDGDALVQTFPMSAGSNANPTRDGAHVVLQSYRMITMDSSTFGLAVDAPGGYRADVEYAVRISNNGEFVHAAPWSVGQQGHSNVSHGCVNLSTANAAWFFGFAQVGDVVEVKNSIGPTLSSVDGDIYDWAIPWDAWKGGSALK
jgi:lipoprotein-anchoring transpeptidase ErfK/SrfK